MSILLEALKKSDQSRQLGETPTLNTAVESPPPSDGSSGRPIPVLLVILSAVIMAWFGWQQFRMPDPVDTIAEPALVNAQEPREPEGTDATESRPRTMAEAYQAQAQRRRAEKSVEAGASEDEKQRLKESFDSFVAQQDSAPDGADAEVADTASGRDVEKESPVAEKPVEEAAAPGLKPHIAEPISYWELPQGVRDSLPEIRISVLVFAADPGDRFVLSNGQRLVEKDELDGGLVLDEIRRDGAVFRYRKYRFLVKG